MHQEWEKLAKKGYSWKYNKKKGWCNIFFLLQDNIAEIYPFTFFNILSDCHYSDVTNRLLNAFRLKKTSLLNQQNLSEKYVPDLLNIFAVPLKSK